MVCRGAAEQQSAGRLLAARSRSRVGPDRPAARLEGIADPGGICISEDAYRQVRDKIEIEFGDLGDKELKNIARPVRNPSRTFSASSLVAHSLYVPQSAALSPSRLAAANTASPRARRGLEPGRVSITCQISSSGRLPLSSAKAPPRQRGTRRARTSEDLPDPLSPVTINR
jgi:hypothetical protein